MTSTKANPRISASPVALTSLGAVGGARGTAAGGLRVLVEFLSVYDKTATEAVAHDLEELEKTAARAHGNDVRRAQALGRVRASLNEIERISRGKLDTKQRAELKVIEQLEASRLATNRQLGEVQRKAFNQALLTSKTLLPGEVTLLGKKQSLMKEELKLTDQTEQANKRRVDREKQINILKAQQNKLEVGRASLGSRLTGLAIGAVGGIVGGAILGVGFQFADELIGKVGDAIHDLVDPSRHARDAIDSIGTAIVDIARNQNLTVLEAARVKAEQLGLAADQAAVSLLAQYAGQKLANDAVKEYSDVVTANAHPDALRRQAIQQLTEALNKQAEADAEAAKQAAITAAETELKDKAFRDLQNGIGNGAVPSTLDMAAADSTAARAATLYDQILAAVTEQIDANSRAKEKNAAATALLAIRQEALNNALNAQAASKIAVLDSQLGDIQDSDLTKSLKDQIDNASSGGSNASTLRNIDDQIALTQLRQRLKLLGQNIQLEQYSGKFLLEAINVKIAALQKEGDEQDRLNQLLDLQYQMSQQIKRQNGESVADFLGRRTQEQRKQLTEMAALDRENKIAALSDLRDKVQDEVDLEELKQRRLEALRSGGQAAYLKSLREQLQASQEADRAAYEAKKKALEAEKQAIQDKVAEAIRLTNEQSLAETAAALQGVDGMDDLVAISGRITGLKRAKATIEGLVEGFGIPQAIAKPFLDKINAALGEYTATRNRVYEDRQSIRSGSRVAFAKGGIIELTNARSPFGQNIRTGEDGAEIGVILSNRVTQALRENSSGIGQVGPFTLYGSNDPLRDQYELGRTVKRAVEEAMRG